MKQYSKTRKCLVAAFATVLVTALATAQNAFAAVSRVAVNDSNFTYSNGWTQSAGTAKWKGDDHWTKSSGASTSIRFTGTNIALYGAKVSDHGLGDIYIDQTRVARANWKATGQRQDDTLIWQSGTLANKLHTLTIKVATPGAAINIDRAIITKTGTLASAAPVTQQSAPSPTPAAVAATPKPVAPKSAVAASTVWKADSKASGLAWASGAWGENEPARVTAWGTWRGRSSDVETYWVDRSSWDGMANLDEITNGPFGTYAVGIPPFPEGSGGSLDACAAGNYDQQWVAIGNAVKKAGLENKIVIRMGWEFDGDWYEWSASNPQAFANCWIHVFNAAESVAPGIHWAWNPSRGPNHINADTVAAYPGDKYVDTIGLDSSDFYPGATNADTWNDHLNGELGLNYWLGFAKQHHKSLSFPEWGSVAGTQEEAGHDNPYYVQQMHNFFAQNASSIGYEAYFDTTESYWRSEYVGTTDLPKAAAMYKQLWSH